MMRKIITAVSAFAFTMIIGDGHAQNCGGQPAANTVCAGPASGGAGLPGFRALVAADLPAGIPTGFANPTATIGLTAINGSATTAMRSDAAPALSQSISPTMTGNWIFSPTSGNAIAINPASGTTAQGLVITQTGPNTGSQAGQQLYNSTLVTDGINVTTSGSFSVAQYVQLTQTSNASGQKAGLYVNHTHAIATSSNHDQIGLVTYVNSSASYGGTNTGAGAAGALYGINPVAACLSGSTNMVNCSGGEVDVLLNAGASAKSRLGWSIVSADTGTGVTHDAALDIAATLGSWKNAIYLESAARGGIAPIATTGCVICTDGNSYTITTGIDLSAWTITGQFLNGPGNRFVVNGAGTSISLGGQQIISASLSSAATPYVNIIDTAGNGAFSAGGGGASPDPTNYINNTMTKIGNIGGGTTFAQFATGSSGIKFAAYGLGIVHSSAAGVLTSSLIVSADLNITTTTCTNQFLTAISATGTGTCTTDTLASAQHANQGTITTVLHGNASGNPSCAAVSLSADVSGSLSLSSLAAQATNTVVGNATSGSAAPTALAVGTCSTASSALIWTTNTGFGCNTSITASAVAVGGITGLGTGVATALAVNVGTAGSFVVNGGALGSPSSAGTIPAFTLGGTIAGGGNQINNVIIGTSTPLAGFFTTVSASTSLTSPLHIGGAGTTGTQLTFQTTTGNGTTDAYAWKGGNNGATTFASMSASGLIVNLLQLQIAAPTGNDANFVFNTVSTARSATIAFQSAGSAKWQMIKQTDDSYLLFDAANGVSTMLITPGAVAVGSVNFGYTTAATSRTAASVTVAGGLGVSGATYTNTINVITMAQTSVAQSGTVCYNSGTGLLTYDATVGCLTSTMEMKEDWADIPPEKCLSMALSMKAGSFSYKRGMGLPDDEQIGFNAQQIATVDERLVARDSDGKLRGVRYQQASSLYACALQKMQSDNDNLREQIRAIGGR